MAERRTTPEDVRWAYRLLLGREAENPDVVLHWVNEWTMQRDMVMAVLRSEEARNRLADVFE